MSPDLGGKKEAMALLDYAGRLQSNQQQNQQQANQFNQNMAYNREQGAALGATEAAKMKQQREIEAAKINADAFGNAAGGVNEMGQRVPDRIYSKKTGKPPGEEAGGDTSNQMTPDAAEAIKYMQSNDTTKQKQGSGYLQKHFPEIYKMFQQG
jgi:hypothetical protein